MTELMTTRQVQETLKVDRTTVYRMLKDGRLTGVKVGSQWRFRREEIDNLLSLAGRDRDEASSPTDILPLHCIQSIQNVFAQIAEVGAVVTGMDGEPVSKMSHCCKFCSLIQSSPSGYEACLRSWQKLAREVDREPIFHPCHAGLQYARGYIEVREKPAAMIISGQFYLSQPDPGLQEGTLQRLAEEHEIDLDKLTAAADQVPVLEEKKQAKITHWISEVAYTFGEIGEERAEMLERLRLISEMSQIG